MGYVLLSWGSLLNRLDITPRQEWLLSGLGGPYSNSASHPPSNVAGGCKSGLRWTRAAITAAAPAPQALAAVWTSGFLFTWITMFTRGVASLTTAEVNNSATTLPYCSQSVCCSPLQCESRKTLLAGPVVMGKTFPQGHCHFFAAIYPVPPRCLNTLWAYTRGIGHRGGGGGGGSAGVAPAMVWAGAWLGPTLPTVYQRLVVGGENGHRFSYGENL